MTTTSDYGFEFVDAPPERARGRNELYRAFALALKARPGDWAKWPREFEKENVASATRRNIVAGKMANFPAGEFEATASKGVVYVRYVGGDAA